ncbi:GNAT family N-acetyltransferase [Parvularcula dongshanensis]|uniref:N-acetyltransferase domain-containing protein n=1 Tax=Parvularcula dongshanensis TaxID=1173995 RepID=A0A840I407_9PROT|nr:GNAT family N-acetyltransferase [Parvularcula dongshanensis]MBB4659507.1 hypothetical protein [Parvularcula dongshanensis]
MTPSSTLRFEREEADGRGRLLAIGEAGVAELTYRIEGDRLIATHTGVPPSMEGRGVGTALIERLYELVTERGLKVVPACSFVRVKMGRRPEWRAVLAA